MVGVTEAEAVGCGGVCEGWRITSLVILLVVFVLIVEFFNSFSFHSKEREKEKRSVVGSI